MRAFLVHNFLLLFSHCFTYNIGTTHWETGQFLHYQHYLFLVNDNTICRSKYWFKFRGYIFNIIRIMFVLDIIRDIIHWAWTIQCNTGNDILKAVRLQLSHKFLHSVWFKLKYAICIAWCNHIERFFIIQDTFIPKRDIFSSSFLDFFLRDVNDCQISQHQQVFFQIAEMLCLIHIIFAYKQAGFTIKTAGE